MLEQVQPPPPQPRSAPIGTLLMMLFGIFVFLSVVPLGALSYFGASSTTTAFLQERASMFIGAVEHSTKDVLEPVEAQMKFIAAGLGSKNPDPRDESRTQSFILGALAGTPQVAAIGFVRPDGSTTIFRRKGKTITEEPFERVVVAPSALAEAQLSRSVHWGKVEWSRIYHQPIITARAPIYEGDEFFGVVVAAISMADLSARLAEISADGEQVPFILVDRQTVLAHPRLANKYVIKNLPDRTGLPTVDAIDDPVLAGIWSLEKNVLTAYGGFEDFSGHWSWVGRNSHGYLYKEIKGFGPTPWIIGIHEPGTNTRVSRWTVRIIGILASLLLLLGLLSALLVARRVGRPMKAFASAADQVQGFNFQELKSLPRTSITEVNETARALEQMATGLEWFETYLPRAQVRRLISLGSDAANSEQKTLTILFFDLAGFTAYSSAQGAEEAVRYLSEVFGCIGPIIEESGGTIDKYTGDGLLAFWGAPGDMDDHAKAACSGALKAADALDALVKEAKSQGKPFCRARFGIHTGEAIVGNIGFKGRVDYTIVGEAVNAAQRVESAAREPLGDALSIVVCSDATKAAASECFTYDAIQSVPEQSELPGKTIWRLAAQKQHDA